MKKELILFDNDGILVETEQWFYQANKEVLESAGISLPIDDYMQIMVRGASALDLLKGRYTADEIEKFRQNRIRRYQELLLLENLEIPGVLETLARLRPQFKMAIVTTSMPDDFDLIHRDGHIISFMDKIFTRRDYRYSKPHPEPYLTALDYFTVPAEKAIVIEDSERGLKSALAAKIDCIIIKNKFTESQNFSGALQILESIIELPDLLNR
ncbi:MAG: HAD family phosphatase [Candidatus Marinimicrobia bacterium]|nr:HAD family phosphatase [Candidatus Neomarinimicrobiota bacterium]